jgi:hypothetical protein
MTLEDDLRHALRSHAETVEPSDGGLDRIEARLGREPSNGPGLAPRLLAAAVVLLVAGVVGVVVGRGTSSDDVVALPSSSTVVSSGATAIENELPPLLDGAETAADPSSTGSAPTEATPEDFDLPAAPAGVLGPRAASPSAAVAGFLELIQRSAEEVSVEYEGSLARVTRTFENGEIGDVTVLQLGSVELDDGSPGVVVVQAVSPRVVIESPSLLSTTTGPMLSVSGQGEGFEATVDVELYSSDDGVWLSRQYASAGNFGVVAPFATELPVSGSGSAWLVVQSAGGTATRLEPFSAMPVVIDAPRAEPVHLVTSVSADDPDGGLVVRSLPGTDGEQLGVLPPGLSGVRKRAALSVFVGDGEPIYGEPASAAGEEWWNVWLPEPLATGRDWGWVNSRYLTADVPAPVAELSAVGEGFVAGLRGDDQAFDVLPWSETGVTIGLPTDLRGATAQTLADPAFWGSTDSWILPEALVGTLDGTPRVVFSPTQELLGPDTAVMVTVLGSLEASPFGNDNEILANRFPGATVVQLTDPANDGSGWRTINLFVARGPDGLEIVGVVAIVWTP